MKRIFSEYLRACDRPSPGAPVGFDELWKALRAALVSELKKRGLWLAPPKLLGVYGSPSWGSRGDDGREEALEELLTDCYVFIFVDRAGSLRAQLEVKDNVDGLVFLNIRHFLLERQRRCDPLGFHVFQVIRAALHEAVADGELLSEGGAKVHVDGVLLFAGADRGAEGGSDWSSAVRTWSDELLPELLTARGPGKRRVIAEVRRLLRELPERGFAGFRPKELLDPLQREVRARWAALGRQEAGAHGFERAGDGELLELVRLAHPDTTWEDQQSFLALTTRVEERIARHVATPRVQRHLRTLWRFLCSYAAGQEPAGSSELPSQRRLAALLSIPRNRLPELLVTLRGFVGAASDGEKRSVTG